jgi:hypothetical protein
MKIAVLVAFLAIKIWEGSLGFCSELGVFQP